MVEAVEFLEKIMLLMKMKQKKINQIEISENESRLKIIKSIENAYKRHHTLKKFFQLLKKSY